MVLFFMNIYSFDFDGTLLKEHFGKINENIYSLLNSLLDNGNVVIINSGRPYYILKKYFMPLKNVNNLFYSIDNGAAIINNDKYILTKNTDFSDLKILKKIYKEASIFAYGLDDVLYTFDVDEYCVSEQLVNEMELKQINMEDDLSKIVFLKYLICGPKMLLDSYVYDYKNEQYHYIRTKETMVEIMDNDADKVTAIDYVKSLFININNIFVFGDGSNDEDSIKKYCGITFINGTDNCKKLAKYVSSFDSDQGVIDAFNNFDLLKY